MSAVLREQGADWESDVVGSRDRQRPIEEMMVALLHSLADLVIVGDPPRLALERQIDVLLRADPERDEVRAELLHLLQMPHWPSQPRRVGSFAAEMLELATKVRRYRLRRLRIPREVVGSHATRVVMIECYLPAAPAPRMLAEQFGLTPREAHVAELLVSRLSTREIAQALGISTHTVRRHVEAVLRKLGVRSRMAASDVLRRVSVAPIESDSPR
jgi:DNA-binding CsgD family transcriptional regulator